jgi:AraC-like DNA-binding protein
MMEDRLIMQRGKLTFDPARQSGKTGNIVEVLGYHCVRSGIYESPGGVENWRIMMFHTPMSVTLGDGRLVQVPAHAATIFDSRKQSRYGKVGDALWDHSWIRLAGPDVPRLLKRAGLTVGTLYPFDTPDDFIYWIDQINRELTRPTPDSGILECLVSALLLRMYQASVTKHPHPCPGIERARLWLEAHCLNHFKLDEPATIAGLSRSHFCARFREATGYSPLAYARRLQLQHAALLLEDIGLSVKEVATQCGFYDAYHFSRCFSARYGKSPTAFRKCRGSRTTRTPPIF